MSARHLLAALVLLLLTHAARAEPDAYISATNGRTLVTAGDCVACHTAPGGAPFAGGLALRTPFGTIMTANLTPDDDTGIGRWSGDAFARAMHDGIRPDGRHLYPAFPYTYYTKLTRADVDAIFAFLRTLPPVANRINRRTLPFPFSIRASMVAWNALFLKKGRFTPDPNRSEEFNRGAYLVQGLGHCGACHTPLNAFGANRDVQYLQSNVINDWTAPNITNDARLGLGQWSVDDIVQYLHTGQNAVGAASGPMAEVIAKSTAFMPTADLHAMAVYLKERGAAGSDAPTPPPATDARMQEGEAIFTDTCAACHQRSGAGVPRIFPRLANNPIVLQDDPTTLVRVVLTGTRAVATAAAPTAAAMPALGFRLNDSQVAAVLTYIRNSWGNAAAPVSNAEVRRLRGRVTTSER
jgi:mono/diheme cytochrome c family protein